MLYFTGRFHLTGSISWQVTNQESEGDGLTLSFTLYREINKRQALTYLRDALKAGKVYWLYPIDDVNGEWFLDAQGVNKTPELNEHLGQGFDWLKGRLRVIPQFDKRERTQTIGDETIERSEIHLQFIVTEAQAEASIKFRDLPDPSHAILRFQNENPDRAKCAFVMMDYQGTDLHNACMEVIREVCLRHGILALRTEDQRYAEDALLNTRTYMHGCGFGIALFEQLTDNEFNPNISLEVGYMLALGKPICILKDIAIDTLPSDLIKGIYEPYDPNAPEATITPVLERWLEEKHEIAMIPKNWTF